MCGEDGVGGIAGIALEIAAAEMAVGLHVADDGKKAETLDAGLVLSEAPQEI